MAREWALVATGAANTGTPSDGSGGAILLGRSCPWICSNDLACIVDLLAQRLAGAVCDRCRRLGILPLVLVVVKGRRPEKGGGEHVACC